MRQTTCYLIEGIDRVGKNSVIAEIQHRLGYHLVLHYSKPQRLQCLVRDHGNSAEREFQAASFKAMFELIANVRNARIICNRAHLGECVYAPLYRGYSGDYVFDLERSYAADIMGHARLVLLIEDFAVSRHFVDDAKSLGPATRRIDEQALFQSAFDRSTFQDKRLVSVTEPSTGKFRVLDRILDEVLQ